MGGMGFTAMGGGGGGGGGGQSPFSQMPMGMGMSAFSPYVPYPAMMPRGMNQSIQHTSQKTLPDKSASAAEEDEYSS